MYLIGASGHAKVIIDILESAGIKVQGLFDDDMEKKELCGIKVLGKYNGQALEHPLIISIGNNRIRADIASRLTARFGSAISPYAIVSSKAVLHEGTVIMQGAIIQAYAYIGSQVIINTGASVDHDCFIDNFVHISPHASLCGGVKVGEGTHIGAGATVIPNINIGKWCTIGAGAVVIKDIPDYCTAVGVPSKIIST